MASHRKVFGVGPDAAFDEDRSVILNAYTGGSEELKKSFDAAPKHRDDAYNAMCADELDYARGDDFLQTGQINMTGGGALSVQDRRTEPARHGSPGAWCSSRSPRRFCPWRTGSPTTSPGAQLRARRSVHPVSTAHP